MRPLSPLALVPGAALLFWVRSDGRVVEIARRITPDTLANNHSRLEPEDAPKFVFDTVGKYRKHGMKLVLVAGQ